MNTRKIEPTSIAAENYLQTFIKNNPQTIPVSDIKEDLRLLILAREFPTTSGPIDALGIDQDGNIYVIETKLAKNPDKRYVIAQVLDYGAALWNESENLDEFMRKLESTAAETLGRTLAAALEDFVGDGEDVEPLRTAIRENLVAGELRFVVLMDHIEDRLRNLITFVNRNSQFTIYGVEMEFYKFDNYEILIPKLYGSEVTKKPPTAPTLVWTEERFFEAVKNQVFSKGHLVLNFNWLPDNEHFASIESRFVERLKEVAAIHIPSDFSHKRTRLDFEQWSRSIDDFAKAVSAIKQQASQSEVV